MNEEIEYAEMLEIPVSTVNVVRKKRRKKTGGEQGNLSERVVDTVNDRMQDTPAEALAGAAQPSGESGEGGTAMPQTSAAAQGDAPAEGAEGEGTQPQGEGEEGGRLHFDPVPERVDTVRLYDTYGEGEGLSGYESLNEGGRYAAKTPSRRVRLALGIEFGVACALCGGIFLTNVFMPNSAINTFFRAMSTPTETVAVKPYTEFTLSSVVSELCDAKMELSPAGVLSFQEKCCVYPAADGKVSEVTQNEDGSYTLKINHDDSFTGVFTGLNVVYYGVGDSVKSNVPVGYTNGETGVQVTMYAGGELLNCFQLTEENCLAWVSQ